MKKLFIALILGIGAVSGILYATTNDVYPPLNDGDLIFQTSTSNQSMAILVATAHPFTHMGIIKHHGDHIVVIEAAAKVKDTPLRDWINRGVLKRFAIYRDPELTPEQAKIVISSARALYGKPYDIFFSFNNDAIYCSELPYMAFKKAGISIGRIQKVSQLHFDNVFVKKLIKQRWRRDHECKIKNYDFEKCYEYILNQNIVTPASIAKDRQFREIYSNYP